MQKNFALLGITILLAAQNVLAVDVHNFVGDDLKTSSDYSPYTSLPLEELEPIDFVSSDTLNLRESTVRAHFVNQNRSALRLATIR